MTDQVRHSKLRLTKALLVAAVLSTLAILGLEIPAEAQPLDSALDATAVASCAGGSGRIETTITNTSAGPLVVELETEGRDTPDFAVRRFIVGAFDTETINTTGRPNGGHRVYVNREIVADVTIDCSGVILDPFDDFANAERSYWSLLQGRAYRGLTSQGGELSRTTEVGEPLGCTFGDGGTVWYRIPVPASQIDVQTFRGHGIAVYTSEVASPGFADLTRIGCIEPNTTGQLMANPGDLAYIQASGPSDAELEFPFPTGVAELRSDFVLPPEIEAVDFTHRCIASGGVVSITIRNTGDSTQTLQVQPVKGRQQVVRSVTVEPGAMATVEVSSRPDGSYELHLNGVPTGELAWVGCTATGPNDTIETATEVTFVDGEAVVLRSRDMLYSFSPDELEWVDPEGLRCVPRQYSSEGTAWSTFVVPEVEFTMRGNDDQDVSIWRSLVDEPRAISDLEPIFCGDAVMREPIELVPGERYWIVTSDEPGDVLMQSLAPPTLAPNDKIADARELGTVEFASDATGTVDTDSGETTPCGFDHTLWWKTTVTSRDSRDFAVERFSSFDADGRPTRAVPIGFGIWSSEIDNPSYDDLSLVTCGNQSNFDDLEPGRQYWIQVHASPRSRLAITPDATLLMAENTVVCNDAGIGVIEETITNQYDVALELVVSLFDRSLFRTTSRVITIEAGETQTVKWGSRLDGGYSIEIIGVPTRHLQRSVTVDCNERADQIEIVTSCLSGSGRIDVFLTSDVSESHTVTLVGRSTLIDRRTSSDLDTPGRVTITGRRNGDYQVEVVSFDGAERFDSRNITIDC